MKLREVVGNGLMYILSAGCQWRAIPRPASRSTLYDYFDLWNWDGTLDRIHGVLDVECREGECGRLFDTAIIDSQSVKSAEKGQRDDPWLRCGQEDQRQEAAYLVDQALDDEELCMAAPMFRTATAACS